MLKAFRTGLSRLLRAPLQTVRNRYLDGYAITSYSQEGEDMILRRLFENQASGFYVDVGAHHPFRFSNTCFFYKKGWRGINLDATPGSMVLFERFRSRDINLEIPVSNSNAVLTFHVFNEPALNGFSKELSQARQANHPGYVILEEPKLQTRELSDILAVHLPAGAVIDFLTVDVEGHDFEVLKSNDWERFRPHVVLVEIAGRSLAEIERHDIGRYLQQYGYIVFAKTVHTVIFVQKSVYEEKLTT